jgi:hypothetical protein
MPEVILSLNASKYNKDLSASMELTEAKAKEAAEAVSRSAAEAGDAGAAAGKRIAKEGKKAAQTLKESFSKWRETFSAGKAFEQFAGPLAAVELLKKGISLCIDLAKDLWDHWTTSSREASQIADAQLKNLKEQAAESEKMHSQSESYLQRLQELASAEKRSVSEKQEMANIIDILNSKYKDLNLSIQNVTGSTAEFDAAQKEILKARAAEKTKNLQREKSYLDSSISANANLAFDNMGNIFERKVLGLTGEKQEILDILTNRHGSFSDESHVKFLENLLSKATQENEITAIEKLLEQTKRRNDVKSQISSIQKTGYASEEERLFAEAARNRRNRQLNQNYDARQQQIQASIAAITEAETLSGMSPAEKQKHYENKLNELNSSISQNDSSLSIARAELDNASAAGHEGYIVDAKKKVVELEQKHLDLLSKRKQIQSSIAALTEAEKKAEKDLAVKDRTAYARQSLLDRAKSLQYQTLTDRREVNYLSSLDKFEQQKGSEASAEEKDLLRRLADLTVSLTEKSSGRIEEIQTNSLTARGGFQTGAVSGDTNAVYRQIEKNTNLEQKQSEEIRRLVYEITSILKG